MADQGSNSVRLLLNQSVQATAGLSFTGSVGSFTDANPLATASEFAAIIVWGDQTPPTTTQAAKGSTALKKWPGRYAFNGKM